MFTVSDRILNFMRRANRILTLQIKKILLLVTEYKVCIRLKTFSNLSFVIFRLWSGGRVNTLSNKWKWKCSLTTTIRLKRNWLGRMSYLPGAIALFITQFIHFPWTVRMRLSLMQFTTSVGFQYLWTQFDIHFLLQIKNTHPFSHWV